MRIGIVILHCPRRGSFRRADNAEATQHNELRLGPSGERPAMEAGEGREGRKGRP